ncbi:MAG TPA: NAD(P)-dependent oxidoreductase [Bacteroidales bacterium]|nr:NAD(P)-dependent oxidoreductase [Bacteroidales bacterium]
MKIAIIGATGFVGSAILKEALSRGHLVTAIMRNEGKLTIQDPALVKISADVMDTEKLVAILKGHELIISAYNAGWTNPDIYPDYLKGAASIQSAVKKSGVSRLIVINGAGSLFLSPDVQLVDSPSFPAEYKPGALAARDYFESLKKETTLNWTVITPAIEMSPANKGEKKGTYRTGEDSPVMDEKGRSSIMVEDFALAVMDEAEDPKHPGKRFTVGY